MSTDVYFQPVSPQWKRVGDIALKHAFRQKHMLGTRNLLDESDLSWLEGMVAAGLTDAKELIEAINTYGTILVEER